MLQYVLSDHIASRHENHEQNSERLLQRHYPQCNSKDIHGVMTLLPVGPSFKYRPSGPQNATSIANPPPRNPSSPSPATPLPITGHPITHPRPPPRLPNLTADYPAS